MKASLPRSFFALAVYLALAAPAAALEVMITPQIGSFDVRHGDRIVTVMRNQDTGSILTGDFSLTSRPCPPFCAQPMTAAPGVKTIGEVELVEFMRGALAEGSGLLIDARTPDWHGLGTIPGSVNIPFIQLNPAQGADPLTMEDALIPLGVTAEADGWNFAGTKTVVLWCNGPWCGQSPAAIRGLLSIGYPAEKIAYYRGGLQMWRIFGLPVVMPDGSLIEQ